MPTSIGPTGTNPDAGGGVWTGPLVSPPGAEPGSEPPETTAPPDYSIGPAATYTPASPALDSHSYADLSILRLQLGAFQANSLEPSTTVRGPTVEISPPGST